MLLGSCCYPGWRGALGTVNLGDKEGGGGEGEGGGTELWMRDFLMVFFGPQYCLQLIEKSDKLSGQYASS